MGDEFKPPGQPVDTSREELGPQREPQSTDDIDRRPPVTKMTQEDRLTKDIEQEKEKENEKKRIPKPGTYVAFPPENLKKEKFVSFPPKNATEEDDQNAA
jgi:hypothetical protein